MHFNLYIEQVDSTSIHQVGSAAKNVNSNIAQVVSAAAQSNEMYTAQAARDTAHSLRDFTDAVRVVAASTPHKETQHR